MKKSLLALTAALSFGGFAAAQTAAPSTTQAPAPASLSDVPAGHWAKEAIDLLVSKGILLGYPDGTFRGTQNLTRYEASVIIARLLEQIKNGKANLDPESMAALQAAVQDLAADLAALGVRVSDLEENAVGKDDFARLEARVEEVALGAGDPSAVKNIQSQIDELAARVQGYDALRADVDDNASSIAALNDLTVLLNQDILELQDRVSALEAAQSNFVQRADFSKLEKNVEDHENRLKVLEKNAFIIKPSLTIGYKVSRANRNFDIDRLFPYSADGTIAGNAFSGNEKNKKDARGRMDYGDFGGNADPVIGDAHGLYGFAAQAKKFTVYLVDEKDDTKTSTKVITAAERKDYKPPKGLKVDVNKGINGFEGVKSTYASYDEGETDISVGLEFNTQGKFDTVSSKKNGNLFTTSGNLQTHKIDFDFGIVSKLPSGLDTDTDYPVLEKDGYTYRPLFIRFKNATAEFSVGNNPLIMTVGKGMKFIYGDYLADNNKSGRGDGFKAELMGSSLPVIGAMKPTLSVIYGSRKGANKSTEKNDYGVYYRGARAEITPIGKLTAGLHVLNEGNDRFGNSPARDVVAFGGDLHGEIFGVNISSEYMNSSVTKASGKENATAFYGRIAKRTDKRDFDLSTPAAKFGTDTFNVAVYDLNYRQVSAGVNEVSGLSEANYASKSSSSKLNVAFGANSGKTSAPFANLKEKGGAYVGQQGYGVKLGTTLGPAYVGGYYDSSSSFNGQSEKMTEMGAEAMGTLGIFNVRAGYNENTSTRKGNDTDARRIFARGDVKPGMGLTVGAYYQNVATRAPTKAYAAADSDGGALARGYLISHYDLGKKDYLSGVSCNGFFSTSTSDTDGVGNVLNPSKKLENSADSTCYNAAGAEVKHAGDDKAALVKDLFFRVGYARVGAQLDGGMTYADARYDRKFGIVNARVAGSVSMADKKVGKRAAGTRGAVGLMVRTDPLTGLPFKPQLNGQVGYYTAENNAAKSAFNANGLKYGAGVVLNEFLLPNTRIGVRYDGYQATNRSYTPFSGSTAGKFVDFKNDRTTNLNGVYFEGAYYDMVFSYGMYNLSQKDQAGKEYGDGNGKAAQGQTFKISYKVNF